MDNNRDLNKQLLHDSQEKERKPSSNWDIFIFAFSLLIFVFDVFTPRTTLAALMYIFPLMLAIQARSKGLRFWYPLYFTILNVLAAFLEPSAGVPVEASLFNRTAITIIIWAIPLLLQKNKTSEEFSQKESTTTVSELPPIIPTQESSVMISGGFIMALAIALLMAGQFYRNTKTMSFYEGIVSQTNMAIQKMSDFLSYTKDAETGQRGFILTGKQEYLQTYFEARKHIDTTIVSLQKIIADNPSQQKRLQEILSLLKDKLAELQLTIDLRKTRGFQAANEIVETGRGKAIMDTIRQRVAAALNEQQTLLQARKNAKDTSERNTIQTVVAGAVLSYALIFIILMILRKELARRTVAEKGLLTYQKTLNSLVENRTKELKYSNDILKMAQRMAHLGYWTYDIKAQVSTWSEEMFKIYGRDPQKGVVPYEEHPQFIYQDDWEMFDQAVQGALKGVPYNIIVRVRFSDGSIHYANTQGNPQYDAGAIVGLSGTSQDITDLKKAEERIKWLSTFPEYNPNPIVEVDSQAHITYANASAKQIFHDLDEPESEHPFLEDIQSVFNQQKNSQDSKTSRELEINGHWYHKEFHYIENLDRLRVYSLDISDRKKAEEALAESEKRYRGLFNSMEEGFCIVQMIFDAHGKSVDYRFMEINAAFEKQTGLHEAKGKLMRELAPDHEEHWFEIYGKIALTGEPAHFVNEAKALDRFYEVYAYRVGRPEDRHVAIIFNDISAIKRAERVLRESEEQFRTMADAIPQLAWIAKADGYIYWYNQRWYEYTGTTPDQMEGWGWQRVHDSTVLPKVLEKWASSIATGHPFEMEFPLKGADGVFRTFLTRVMPLKDPEGHVIQWFGTNTDVSERMKAEERIKWLSTFPENDPNPIVEVDAAGNITYANESAKQFFPDLVDTEGKHPFLEDIQSVFMQQKSAREKKIVKEIEIDGRWYHKEFHYSEAFDRLRIYYIDITERKEAEQELEATAEFLTLINKSKGTENLLQAATTFFQQRSACHAVGIRLHKGEDYPYCETRGFPEEFVKLENNLCTRNMDGTIVRDHNFNPVMECMCGSVICGRFDSSKPFFTQRGSFWTNSTTELLAGTTDDDRQARTRNHCNGEGYESVALIALKFGNERLGLLQLNDRQKGRFTVETIALWEKLADYLAIALSKFIAEETLQESEKRLKFHFENSPLAVVEWDSHCIVTQWSSEAEHMFGWKKEETLGKRIDSELNLVYEADIPDVSAVMERLSGGKEPVIISSNRNYTKSGAVIDCTWYNSVLLDQNGHMASVISLIQDITARKKAEEALLASNRELEQFAYVASHDLQEPLRMVASFTELLQRNYQEKLDERGLKYMRFIMDGSSRMQTLIQDLLTFSRIGRLESQRQSVDCNAIMDTVIIDLSKTIKETSAEVTHDNLPRLMASESSMSRLFMNLVSNALKFRKKDHTPRVHVTAVRKYNEWEFAVSDNGIGIDSQYYKKLFVIFQRLHGREEYPGSGMGLAICKKIVTNYGGKIWVESQLDKGTTFYFTIPQ
ncbi:MAG: PAS domain S-box protein [Endomicrobiales bacterium]